VLCYPAVRRGDAWRSLVDVSGLPRLVTRRETALERAVANAEEPNCHSWQPTVVALIIAGCGGDAGKIDQHWCVRAFMVARTHPMAIQRRAWHGGLMARAPALLQPLSSNPVELIIDRPCSAKAARVAVEKGNHPLWLAAAEARARTLQ
jgi:hypothetical protein